MRFRRSCVELRKDEPSWAGLLFPQPMRVVKTCVSQDCLFSRWDVEALVGNPNIDRKEQRTVGCFKKDTIKQYWVL